MESKKLNNHNDETYRKNFQKQLCTVNIKLLLEIYYIKTIMN